MIENHKKTCRNLIYFEHFLLFISGVTGCVSIYAFSSLVGIPIGIISSTVGLKMCSLTARMKKCKSVIKKKKKKKHDKIVSLEKSKLYTIEVLISKALMDSYISHGEFVSVSNVLREYNQMK